MSSESYEYRRAATVEHGVAHSIGARTVRISREEIVVDTYHGTTFTMRREEIRLIVYEYLRGGYVRQSMPVRNDGKRPPILFAGAPDVVVPKLKAWGWEVVEVPQSVVEDVGRYSTL